MKNGGNGRQMRILKAGLAAYVLVLGIAAIDQWMGRRIFPSALDRILAEKVASLGDAAIPMEQRVQTLEELVACHEFAVPHLLKALERGPHALREPAAVGLTRIGVQFFSLSIEQAQAFGDRPKEWRAWWQTVRDGLDTRVP